MTSPQPCFQSFQIARSLRRDAGRRDRSAADARLRRWRARLLRSRWSLNPSNAEADRQPPCPNTNSPPPDFLAIPRPAPRFPPQSPHLSGLQWGPAPRPPPSPAPDQPPLSPDRACRPRRRKSASPPLNLISRALAAAASLAVPVLRPQGRGKAKK
ncbi:hypothetical protein F4780DRAFT_756583 [Xylariomycetidae sp. FL0641]|nr:hypothetical protein F4780DRAFT_756583 [Xylariomycetidae sp. FL0641]